MSDKTLIALSLLLAALGSACSGGRPDAPPAAATGERELPARSETAAATDDVVVIAVIDSGLNPYHFDFLAAHMPQQLNEDPADDLPLDQDPARWLPGHPGAAAFRSYTRLDLTLTPEDPFRFTDELAASDFDQWSQVTISEGSANAQVHMYWFPGTKIIGHVVFPPRLLGDPVTSAALGRPSGSRNSYAASSHGVGSASVSAGNLYGSCPHCLLVFVDGPSEEASEWVAQQDWIDLQTNSWGVSTIYRERAYAGSDTELQRRTVDRGQSIFFSAGNGQGNAFVAPNTTLLSSQEGPDWIVTVGAISPANGSSYSGHGKPADIASIGSGYPSARGSSGTTSAQGNFSGTSNATPVIAGLYGEALYRLRRFLDGPSRLQADGVIALGQPGCAAANADCALADGMLSVHELRQALFRAARYSDTGTNVGGLVTLPATENQAELEFLSEGHGSYRGRLPGPEHWNDEVERIVGFARGAWYAEQEPAQRDWFIADSICRQAAWGAWEHGYATRGPAPPADPEWPARSFLTEVCPQFIGELVAAERALQELP